MPLFRERAVAAHRPQPYGEPLKVVAPSVNVLLTGIVFAAAIGLVTAGQIEIAKHETATGYLQASPASVYLKSPRAGLVTRLATVSGAAVPLDAPLVEIDVAAGEGTDARALDLRATEITRQGVLLDGDAVRNLAHVQQELAAYENRVAAFDRQRGALQAQVVQRRGAEVLVEQAVARARVLVAQKMVTDAWADERERDRLAAATERAKIEEQQSAIEATQAETRAQVASLRRTFETLKTQTGLKRSELTLRGADDRFRKSLVLQAPTAGTVEFANLSRGQAIQPGQVLGYIVPEGQVFKARVLLPARAAAAVRGGQTVQLKLQAYPYAEFGSLQATVLRVSQVLLPAGKDSELVDVAQPYATVEVELPRQGFVDLRGSRHPLSDGMPLSAEIQTEKHSFLYWVFGPFIRAIWGDPA